MEKLASDECVMEVQHNSELRYQLIVDICLASKIDSPFHRIPCLGSSDQSPGTRPQ